MGRSPRQWMDEDRWNPDQHGNVTVYEADGPQKTGLLDAKGRPLIKPRQPIGFKIPVRG